MYVPDAEYGRDKGQKKEKKKKTANPRNDTVAALGT
jgi:hypothetical protein